MEHDGGSGNSVVNVFFTDQIHGLQDVVNLVERSPCGNTFAELQYRLSVHKIRSAQFVLPIIVMCEVSHRGFDASKHYGDVGKQLFQNMVMHNCGIFRFAIGLRNNGHTIVGSF